MRGMYEDYQEVARTFGVKPGTAYAIVRRYRITGEVARRRGGANNSRALQLDSANLIYKCRDLHTRKVVESSLIKIHSNSIVNLSQGLLNIDPFLAPLIARVADCSRLAVCSSDVG